MKLTFDVLAESTSFLEHAKRELEEELMDARDILSHEDLPEPRDRFEAARSIVVALLSDLRVGDVGLAIADIVEALEDLAEELPND